MECVEGIVPFIEVADDDDDVAVTGVAEEVVGYCCLLSLCVMPFSRIDDNVLA